MFDMLNARVGAKGGLSNRVLRQVRRFRRDEDGSMIIFTLFLILMMLIVGGMAVDLMRFETNRSRLQATSDRATLAAADLDQTLSPEAVVRDYFEKAGLLDQLSSVTVTETFNSRMVSVQASVQVNMMFMDLLGVAHLDAPAASTARETVTDIEIALVLDVSGSMNSNSRITNLRIAASRFVANVLSGDVDNKISITIVPFNAQVNIGLPLRQRFNVTDLSGITNSNCIDLPVSQFTTPGISTTLAMPQSGYFDATTATTRNSNYIAIEAPNFTGDTAPTCKTATNNIVRLASNNVPVLQGYVNGLSARGNTSITLGMKWALALLDPSARPTYTSLIGSGDISSNYAGRPYDYNRPNTLKVIIVMTDGEHVKSYLLNPGYRVGNSPIYRATSDGNYSIRFGLPLPTGATFPVGKPVWVPHLSRWDWRMWNGTNPPAVPAACANNNDLVSDPDGNGVCVRTVTGATVQTWPQVWTNLRMHWVAWQLYARGLSSNNTNRITYANAAMDAFYDESMTPAAMDVQLQTSCTQARNNGIVIFGIAFEAPPVGKTQVYDCTGSSSHYYEAVGAEIGTVFDSIASQINSLRLMQ